MSNNRFKLGVHALVLIEIWDGPTSSRVISYSIDTNPTVIRRVMGDLESAGLVASKLGPGGGFTLAKPADEITLLNVYEAVESGPVFKPYRDHTVDECPVGSRVSDLLDDALDPAVAALRRELSAVTIAILVEDVQSDAEAELDVPLLDSLWEWREAHERRIETEQ